MKCIICNKNEASSKEHIIPYKLGNNALVTHNICKECNNELGQKVDYILTDNLLIKAFRKYKVKGENPKIFHGKETDVYTGRDYILKDGKYYLKPGIIVKENGTIELEVDVDDDPQEFARKYLLKKDLSDLEVENVLNEIEIKERNISAPVFVLKENINFSKLALPLVKIAFELTFESLGETYRRDEMYTRLKTELLNALKTKKYDAEASSRFAQYIIFYNSHIKCISQLHKKLLESFCDSNTKFNKQNVLHALSFFKQGNELWCIISLFLKKEFTCCIKVSTQADSYKYHKTLFLIFNDGQCESY